MLTSAGALTLALPIALAAFGAPPTEEEGAGSPAPANGITILTTDDGRAVAVFPPRDGTADGAVDGKPGALGFAARGGTSNLSYHGGPVLLSAKAMLLFWGNFSSTGSDVPTYMSGFFGQFGTSAAYVTITQYYNASGTKISTSSLGGFVRYDTTTPPSTVSDTAAQNQIAANFANGNLGTPDPSTVYFLYLPNGVTSTLSGYASCTNYCGYHSNFTYNGVAVKYAVMPFPSCTGCQGSAQTGHSIYAASLTITSGHEMREAATDALGTAWYDRTGNEADDKCAWKLFIDPSGYQLQKEWANAVSGCVMGGITGP